MEVSIAVSTSRLNSIQQIYDFMNCVYISIIQQYISYGPIFFSKILFIYTFCDIYDRLTHKFMKNKIMS